MCTCMHNFNKGLAVAYDGGTLSEPRMLPHMRAKTTLRGVGASIFPVAFYVLTFIMGM